MISRTDRVMIALAISEAQSGRISRISMNITVSLIVVDYRSHLFAIMLVCILAVGQSLVHHTVVTTVYVPCDEWGLGILVRYGTVDRYLPYLTYHSPPLITHRTPHTTHQCLPAHRTRLFAHVSHTAHHTAHHC